MEGSGYNYKWDTLCAFITSKKLYEFTTSILKAPTSKKCQNQLTQLVARRLAVRQARVRFSARHLMEVLLLLSEEAMKVQEHRPRRMMKDESMYDCTV